MNRRTKWSLVIAGPVLLIGALLIVDMTIMEPYLQYKGFINRRTGKYTQYEVYCDHFAKPYGSNIGQYWVDLSPYQVVQTAKLPEEPRSKCCICCTNCRSYRRQVARDWAVSKASIEDQDDVWKWKGWSTLGVSVCRVSWS
jgi:hypothetical protein